MSNDGEYFALAYGLLAWFTVGVLVILGFEFSEALFGFGLGLILSVPFSRIYDGIK